MQRNTQLLATGLLALGLVALTGCDECTSSRECSTGQICDDGACSTPDPWDPEQGDAGLWDEDPDAGPSGDHELEWIPIPSGTFDMGKDGAVYGSSSAFPVREVTLDAFDMTKSTITAAQFGMCVLGGGCSEPSGDSPYYANSETLYFPASGVTWGEADTYCAWAGGRLPSEAEWEYAARNAGQDVTYPWGEDEPSCEYANIHDDAYENCPGNPGPVCTKPAGYTEQGLCDMVGNVMEFVADGWHASYEGAPVDGSAWDEGVSPTVLRGSHAGEGPGSRYHEATARDSISGSAHNIGFRCVRDAE